MQRVCLVWSGLILSLGAAITLYLAHDYLPGGLSLAPLARLNFVSKGDDLSSGIMIQDANQGDKIDHSNSEIEDIKEDAQRFASLASSVINRIKTYAFFVGMPRSGHSIVGAVLNSHPHIVISNELGVFDRLKRNLDKSKLFNMIWKKGSGNNHTKHSVQDSSKGYSLAIDGLYQGKFNSYIDVIGDKKGGHTSTFFLHNPTGFGERLDKLRRITDLPFKVFHVVRNPFDNIATQVMYKYLEHNFSAVANVKTSSKTVYSESLIDGTIRWFFRLYNASEQLIRRFGLDSLQIHGKDLVSNPKSTIRQMCDFLQVSCSESYLNIVSGKMFTEESKTRYKLKWTKAQISEVKHNIRNFESLARYLEFNS